MVMNKYFELPEDLKTFLTAAGDIFLKPLCALSAAESLTDEVAIQLVIQSGLEEKIAARFIKALHFSDFIVERNSEWNFTGESRSYLSQRLIEQSELFRAVNELLYQISNSSNPSCDGDTIPRYLLSDVGKAYHKSSISPTDGLKLYATAAGKNLSGNQWLLGKLAIEQQEQGILPRRAIEPPFIQGMVFYRERRIDEAEKYLRRVIVSDEIREEVAIACHLTGKIESGKPGMAKEAEELLRRSLDLLEKLHDQHGQAQALHSLGQLIGKNRNRAEEAEKLLKRSVEIGEQIHHEYHQAQALNSLVQLIGKDRNRAGEAEKLLKRSLKIGEQIHHEYHQAQALNPLGQLIGKDRNRAEEAEKLLRRSLEIGEKIHHEDHQAQAIHSLGQLIGKDRNRAEEAEKLLRRSLDLKEKLHDQHGQAQVLHSLGQLIGKDRNRAEEAEKLLRRSLGSLEKLNDRNGQAQVLFSLGKIIWDFKRPEAEQMFRRSIALNHDLNNSWAQKMVQKELDKRLGNRR
jgi:tetratricopeptide (TPR) repeat protein